MLVLIGCFAALPGQAAFSTLWTLGVQDGNPDEFGEGDGQSNVAPGSAVAMDDDYYYAGSYGGGIGTLATAEPAVNWERYLSYWDQRNRVHFILSPAQAGSARFRVTAHFVWTGWWDTVNDTSGKGTGTHSITVRLNGYVFGSATMTQDGTLTLSANATAVHPVAGANTLEFERSGGTVGGSVAFDDLMFEIDPTALVDADGDGLPKWWEEDHGLNDSDASDAAKDQDHDGLTSLQEFTLGTDPNVADSDDDALTDGYEVNTSHTNPLLSDSDGDGLSDGYEVSTAHTNPLLIDTDGDGAPDGWEVGAGYNPLVNSSTPPSFPHAVGIQFVSDFNSANALTAYEVTGYVPQMKWNVTRPLNVWSTPNGDTSDIAAPAAGVLVNSAGGGTGMTVAWTSDNTWGSGNGGGATQKLFDGYLRVGGDTAADLTLAGITFPTYDVILYVGGSFDGAHGYARLNNNPGTDRHFYSGTIRPESAFKEPIGSTSAKPWRGNVIRFRNVSGSSVNLKLFRFGTDDVGIHGIQVVNATADSDGDGMPDWWEIRHQLKPNSAADASQDADADGLTNLQEFQRGSHPRLADTDDDGLSDAVETNTGVYVNATNTGTNVLLPDTDGDGLTDGFEVNTARTNPLLTDTDGDGRSDFDEIQQRTDPLTSNAINDMMPVVTVTPRSFSWIVDNVQIVWDHSRGHVANSVWGEETLFTAAVTNVSAPNGDALRVGLRVVGGRVVHFLYSGHVGAFSYTDKPLSDIWESDWNSPPSDKRAALGFSGWGKVDYSARLRFKVTGNSTGSPSDWTLVFELRNLDSNQVVSSASYTGCTLATSVHDNTASWQNGDFPPKLNRLSLWKHAGVDLYLQSTPLASTAAFAAWKDTDKDGIPDVWEDANSLNKNSAADALLDPDNDGLTNLQEYLAGTNHRSADTDGDVVNDGAELAAGSDPLNAMSKPPYFHSLPAGISGEDFNGNGIPDAFEQWSGSFALLGSRDSDGDGYADAQEAAAGTNPLDPKSRPWLDTLRSGNDLTLRWPLVASKQHRAWQSPDLVTWTAATGSPFTVGGELRQTMTNALSSPKKFYRVSINDLDTDGDGVSDWAETNVLHSSPTSANSLHAAVSVDANHDGVPEGTISGDYAALLERFQGGSANGGFVSGAAGGNTGAGVSRTQAARFLTQATFGPTPADIDRLQTLGYAAWIDEQMGKTPTLHSDYIRKIYVDYRGAHTDTGYNASDTDNIIFGNNLMTAFARAAIQGEDQLRQRVAFALSQILVVSRRDANLSDKPLGVADYYDVFVRRAFGNYNDLLKDVAFHPCMGRYLSHLGNQKANPSINQYPDENFAREVMQLFTIGLWELNPDGTRKTNVLGQNLPTYTNAEITQTARVMTGLWLSGHEWGGGGWSDADYATPMTMHPERHDFGQKTLVRGFVIPQRAGTADEALRDITDALRNLFNHPNCGPFIGKQLIQFLVTDNPSPAYVSRVAGKFADNGSGVRGDLAAVVRAILLDEEARDPRYAENNSTYGRLKEPVIRVMAMARAFGMKGVPDLLWWDWGDFFDNSRQEPTYSPSVFNFYRPEYRAAGLLTTNNLASPVFQITDSYSSISFPNKLWDTIENGFNLWGRYQFPLDLSTDATLAGTPDLLVDRLNLLFCGGRLSAASRTIILNAVAQVPASQPQARARVAAYLFLTSPEGAIMK